MIDDAGDVRVRKAGGGSGGPGNENHHKAVEARLGSPPLDTYRQH
jgi:hypothetical protein